MFNRERVGNLMVSLCLSILLLGLSQGVAHAQTKLVKPASGGTLTINKSGSYFLAANYITSLGNLPVIKITVSNVTINLNGFSIISQASGGGSAIAINTISGVTGVTIVNGTITKMKGTAIVLNGSSTVSGVQLINNNGDGVDCTSSCLVTNNVITGNGGTGLNFSDATSGYQNNILTGNGTNVTGGTSLSHNVCGSSVC